MGILPIRIAGDPVLREKAKKVRKIDASLQKLIDDMIDTMHAAPGVGLAAPQVGIPLRLMVVGDEKGRSVRALVNPVIADQGGEIVAEEGCLSIPGVFADVARAEWVQLEAKDLEGQPVSIRARGLQARVFQHEMDHLDGVLFIDRLDPMTRDRIKRRIKKDGLSEDARHRAFAL